MTTPIDGADIGAGTDDAIADASLLGTDIGASTHVEDVAASFLTADVSAATEDVGSIALADADSAAAVDIAVVDVAAMASDAATADDDGGYPHSTGAIDSAGAVDLASTHGVAVPHSLPTGHPIPNNVYLARNGLDGGTDIVYQDAFTTVMRGLQGDTISVNNSNKLGTSTPFDNCQAEGFGRATWDMRSTWYYKGSGAGRFLLLAPGDEFFCEWAGATLGASSELFTRFYFRVHDFPIDDVVLAEWYDTTTNIGNRLVISPDGVFTLGRYDELDALVASTGDQDFSITEDVWYRLEAHLRFSATAGDGVSGALSAFHIFQGDSRTIVTGAEEWYPNSLSGFCDRFRFGAFGMPSIPPADDSILVYFDDVVLSVVDWIGIEATPKATQPEAAFVVESAWVEITGTVAKSGTDTATGADMGIAIVERTDSDAASFDDPFGVIDFGGVHPVVAYEYVAAGDSGAYEDA